MSLRRIAILSVLVVVLSNCGIIPWETAVPNSQAEFSDNE